MQRKALTKSADNLTIDVALVFDDDILNATLRPLAVEDSAFDLDVDEEDEDAYIEEMARILSLAIKSWDLKEGTVEVEPTVEYFKTFSKRELVAFMFAVKVAIEGPLGGTSSSSRGSKSSKKPAPKSRKTSRK